jgi:mRNA interferase RelE/StbE
MLSAPYTVLIKRSAEREMNRLSAELFERVTAVILSLEREPRPHGCQKLRGLDEYRIRVGAYRVLYTIDDDKRWIEVVAVGHRRDVYRDL